mmetsp:Transcript_30541/g.97528  ORF Transcript_30541/g.97528 Transcript_30541/m.97528 type:complete len:90 (+) Transcript_30541:756-1025(+)
MSSGAPSVLPPAGVGSMLDLDLLSAFGAASPGPPAVDPFLADMFAPTPGALGAPSLQASAGPAAEIARWLEALPALGYMLSTTLVLPSA